MYSVIIVAAGSGSRMNLGYNKMFYEYEGKTLFEHAVECFIDDKRFSEIILVVSKRDIENVKKIVSKYEKVSLILGGNERTHSVLNGIKASKNEINFIHDGARIFLTKELIDRLDNEINKDNDVDGYSLAVKSIDTTLIVKENLIKEKLNRDNIYLMQTPQVVKRSQLISILNVAHKINKNYTDEMSALIDNGYIAKVVEGEYYNKKITTINDINN